MDNCKICNSSIPESPDEIILCEHKEGVVHLGCCVSICSGNGKPCQHCKAMYAKISK